MTNCEKIVTNVEVDNSNNFCKSDHYHITYQISMNVKKIKNGTKSTIYNFKKANWVGLNKDLGNINWSHIYKSNDIHIIWKYFKNTLFMLCDKHIPKIVLKKNTAPPWFDSELDQLCKDKAKLHQKYKKSGKDEDYKIFSIARSKYKKTVMEKINKSLFLDDSDQALITKKFWGYVKYTSNCSQIPKTVKMGSEVKTNPYDKANLFNEHFFNQFSDKSKYDIDIDFNNDVLYKEYDINFTLQKVYNLLRLIKPGKACGPDKIHGKIFKNCAKTLCGPLSVMYNLSFKTAMIPEEWKLSHVVPIFKKGNKNDVSNYRPISLTSLVMKNFEKCVRDELMIKCYPKINPLQHGFLPAKSCNTQLIEFTDSLHGNLDMGICTDIVYFDFSKAFDSVSHDRILYKLKHEFEVDGILLKFIKSYLEDRKQKVVIEGCFSSTKDVLSGVPQGSILGPLFFVLFINDIFNCVSDGTNILLYADDTKIWRKMTEHNDSIILQEDINRLYKWSIDNKIHFNSNKCKVLTVTHRNELYSCALPFMKFQYDHNYDDIKFVLVGLTTML